jgi:hypothetical protein
VAPKETLENKINDIVEMKRIDRLGKNLLPFITKPPCSSVVVDREFSGFEMDFFACYRVRKENGKK